MAPDPRQTHFGYQEVDAARKAHLVRAVFDSIAPRYDLMNDLMSLGLHRRWKNAAVRRSGVQRGQRVLDLAAGTGDLADRFAAEVGPEGRIVLCDVNATMLALGRDRMAKRGHGCATVCVLGDAEALPFPDNSFDCISIAFGLRNVTHKERALGAMLQALRPGGRLLVLEFSRPTHNILKTLYDIYSFGLLPALGRLVARDEASYRYLVESIRVHPDQVRLLAMMEAEGFVRCEVYNLSGGIVALHCGHKPL